MAFMPWENLEPQSGLIIYQKEWLSENDMAVFLHLYQPMLGAESAALYQSLRAQIEIGAWHSSILRHSDLMEQLVMGKEEYIRARQRLEALGLVQVFHNQNPDKQVQTRYDLLAPLPADKFFTDSLMSSLLIYYVGEDRFHRLVDRFSWQPYQALEQADWREVTASFRDVYRLPQAIYPVSQETREHLVRTNEGDKHFDLGQNSKFDLQVFKELLQGSFVGEKALTKEVIDMTQTLHEIFGYDEVSLQRMALEACDIKENKIDLDKYQAIALAQAEADNKAPLKERSQELQEVQAQAQEEAQKLWKEQGLSDEDLEFTATLRNYPSVPFAKSIKDQQGGFLTKNETQAIGDILQMGILNPSTLNVMIHYYLVEDGKDRLSRPLLEATADDWSQHKVDSPEAALLYLRGRLDHQKQAKIKRMQQQRQARYQKKNYQKRSGREEVKPKWFKTGGEAPKPADQTNQQTTDQSQNLRDLIAQRHKEDR